VFDGFGELLFTDYGISGPLALSASAHMREFGAKRYTARIDLKPALNEERLDARILRDFTAGSNKVVANVLTGLVHARMAPVILEHSGIPPDTRAHSVTRAQREKLRGLIKRFEINVGALRPLREAIVTSGGVCLDVIDPRTMSSKLVGGLYFAGEVIDADAYTGGFNLQIAWATAYTAGSRVPGG
jgi:predicted Rossmann fold flavoprotein